MTRDEVIAEARSRWLGTPFRHQARTPGLGTDCIGLIGGIARDHGHPDGAAWEADRDAHNYGRIPNPRTLLALADRYVDRIFVCDVDVADIVLMRFTADPQHFALVSSLAPAYIIHASSSVGRVVENRLDDKWRSRIVRAYRYRGIA